MRVRPVWLSIFTLWVITVVGSPVYAESPPPNTIEYLRWKAEILRESSAPFRDEHPNRFNEYYEFFDEGIAGWDLSGSWEHGTIIDYGPAEDFYDGGVAIDLDGPYGSGRHTEHALISPEIPLDAIPLECGNLIFIELYHWYEFEADGFDKGYVNISTDNGVTWQTLQIFEGYSGDQPDTYNGWAYDFIVFSGYNAQSFQLKFSLYENGNTAQPPAAGWYIEEFFAYLVPGGECVENDFVRVCSSCYDGKFVIGTSLTNENLTFGYPNASNTTHTNFYVDGTLRDPTIYSNEELDGTAPILCDEFDILDNAIYADYVTPENIHITQKLTPVQGENSGAIRIEYFLTNHDTQTHQVGTLLEIDTQVSFNDAAPLATSFGLVTTETGFNAPEIPTYWQAFESPNYDPALLIGQGTLAGADAILPDFFVCGKWGDLFSTVWDYEPDQQPYYDSAVLYRWDPVELAPNETVRFATYYGVGEASFSAGDLAMTLSAPEALQLVNDQLSPNPFEINLLVYNSSETMANNVTASLNLPVGLELVTGELTRPVSPANIPAFETGTASWLVQADDPFVETTLTYSITVNAANMDENYLEREIVIPALPGPALEFDHSAMIFPPTIIENISTQSNWIYNWGVLPLDILAIEVTSPEFSVTTATFRTEVTAGDSLELAVIFAPTQPGPVDAFIIVASNAPTSPDSFAVSGTATAPEMSLSTGEIDFGPVLIGSDATASFFVRNIGTAELEILDAYFDDGPFYLLEDSPRLSATIPPGDSLEVIIGFTPPFESLAVYQSTLEIHSNAFTNPVQTVTVYGEGIAPILSVPLFGCDMGEVAFGETGYCPFSIRNDGNYPLTIDSLNVQAPGQFFISQAPQAPIASGDSSIVIVGFAPYHRGYQDTDIYIYSNDPFHDLYYTTVTGVGIAPLMTYDPAIIEFGDVLIGTSVSEEIIIGNNGDAPLVIDSLYTSQDPIFYAYIPGPPPPENYSVLPGETITVQVQFSPVDEDFEYETLTLLSNDVDSPELTIILTGNGVRPQVYLHDQELNFGVISWTATAADTTSIGNIGSAVLSIDSVYTDDAEFRLPEPAPIWPVVIEPGGEWPLALTFNPETMGIFESTVHILNSDPDFPEVTIDLIGEAIAPVIQVAPVLIQFGEIPLGENQIQLFTVSNSGSDLLIIDEMEVEGEAFSLLLDPLSSLRQKSKNKHNRRTLPDTLTVGETREYSVRFQPVSPGAYQGSVLIYSDGYNEETSQVSLTGTALAPQIAVSDSLLDFGQAALGDTIIQTVELSNIGTSTLALLSFELSTTGGFFLFPPIFAQDTLAVGESIDVRLGFTPLAAIEYTATAQLVTDSFANATIQMLLTGQGIAPQISLDQNSLNFGQVRVGQSESLSLAIQNIGQDTLLVSSILNPEPAFELPELAYPLIILPGENSSIDVTFAPTEALNYATQLTIRSNDPDDPELTLSLQGQGVTPDLHVPVTTLDFGEVDGSADLSFHLYNEGSAALIIFSVTSSDERFVILNWPVTEVPIDPADSLAVTVRFTPQPADSTLTESITILSDDPDESTVVVTVTGSAEPISVDMGSFTAEASDHAVTLQWQFNLAIPLHLINIYRAQADVAHKREKIHSILSPVAVDDHYSYTDRQVIESQTYSYWIEAVDTSGLSYLFGPIQATVLSSPDLVKLHQNFPNPFYPTTRISYELPSGTPVSLKIYNIHGQLVQTLVEAVQGPGYFSVMWDGFSEKGEEVAGGTYFYKLQVGEQIQTRRMTYLR